MATVTPAEIRHILFLDLAPLNQYPGSDFLHTTRCLLCVIITFKRETPLVQYLSLLQNRSQEPQTSFPQSDEAKIRKQITPELFKPGVPQNILCI